MRETVKKRDELVEVEWNHPEGQAVQFMERWKAKIRATELRAEGFEVTVREREKRAS